MITRRSPNPLAALSLLACLVTMPTSRAEVSAGTDETPRRVKIVMVTAGITDDSDPINFWQEPSGGVTQRQVLNSEGGDVGDGAPSIVWHRQSGLVLAAWARHSATGFDVVTSRFAEGDWMVPVVVADVAGDALDPQLAADPASGEVRLVYWVHDEAPRVLMRSATADLSAWSEPVQVSEPGEIAARPHAVVHEGRLLVTYESHTAGFGLAPRQIVLAESVDGAPWLREAISGASFTGSNVPQIHRESGRIWVDWIDGVDVLRWSSRRDGEAWSSLGSEPFSGFIDLEFHARGRVRATVRSSE